MNFPLFLFQSITIQASQNFLSPLFLLLSILFLLLSFRRYEGAFPIIFNLISIFFAYLMVFSSAPTQTKYILNVSNSTTTLLKNVTITSFSTQEATFFTNNFYVLFFFNLALIIYNFAFRYLIKSKKEEE
jgi:hypothetical protein